MAVGLSAPSSTNLRWYKTPSCDIISFTISTVKASSSFSTFSCTGDSASLEDDKDSVTVPLGTYVPVTLVEWKSFQDFVDARAFGEASRIIHKIPIAWRCGKWIIMKATPSVLLFSFFVYVSVTKGCPSIPGGRVLFVSLGYAFAGCCNLLLRRCRSCRRSSRHNLLHYRSLWNMALYI